MVERVANHLKMILQFSKWKLWELFNLQNHHKKRRFGKNWKLEKVGIWKKLEFGKSWNLEKVGKSWKKLEKVGKSWKKANKLENI